MSPTMPVNRALGIDVFTTFPREYFTVAFIASSYFSLCISDSLSDSFEKLVCRSYRSSSTLYLHLKDST